MGHSFQVTSPVDGSLLTAGHYLSQDEALGRLAKAEATANEFKATSVAERVALCRRFLDAFDESKNESAAQVTFSMGKPHQQALSEIAGMRSRTEALCWAAPLALVDQSMRQIQGMERFIRRVPLGVVLDIAAWNYPYVVAVNVVVPAILAGNAVLLKHSPQTWQVGVQMENAFAKAGAPAGLFQDLMVDHETVANLVATRRIAHVGFTGSVRGGKQVYSTVASSSFASCGLELGGKDAAIVLDDADVEKAAISLCDAVFYNAGQSCCAVERIYVAERIYSAFVEAFLAETYRLRLGDPREAGTTLGPVVSQVAAHSVAQKVESALAAGAIQVSDDSRFVVPDLSPCYLPPRVLTGVNHRMELMRNETFGPAIGIMSFQSVEHAIQLTNDSPYGLTASVWTQDHERALLIMEQLDVGTVYMNRADAVDPELPWIGVKDSGLGHTLSHLGILSMTRPKSYNMRLSL